MNSIAHSTDAPPCVPLQQTLLQERSKHSSSWHRIWGSPPRIPLHAPTSRELNTVLIQASFSPTQGRLLRFGATLCGPDGWCYYQTAVWAEHTRISERSLRRAVQDLLDQDILWFLPFPYRADLPANLDVPGAGWLGINPVGQWNVRQSRWGGARSHAGRRQKQAGLDNLKEVPLQQAGSANLSTPHQQASSDPLISSTPAEPASDRGADEQASSDSLNVQQAGSANLSQEQQAGSANLSQGHTRQSALEAVSDAPRVRVWKSKKKENSSFGTAAQRASHAQTEPSSNDPESPGMFPQPGTSNGRQDPSHVFSIPPAEVLKSVRPARLEPAQGGVSEAAIRKAQKNRSQTDPSDDGAEASGASPEDLPDQQHEEESRAPCSAGTSAPCQETIPSFCWPPREVWEKTDLAYYQRVLREREKERVALLVRLASERIGVPLEKTSYQRIGALAKQYGAALLVKHILLAAANHIDGDPLDYLTRLARGKPGKEAVNATGPTAQTRSYQPYTAEEASALVWNTL